MRAARSASRAAATWWSRWRDGQTGATATEYIVLVGVIGLAIVGGAAALQAGTTTAVEGQSDTIGTSPQFAQMPEGSGGPATNPGIPIPPPTPPPTSPDPDPSDPDPDPGPDPDPQPDPDPEPEPPAPTVAFLGNLTETRETTGNRWQATVYLEVTNASQVTLSYTPSGNGSGTVTCTVSNNRCAAAAGDWRTPGQGQGGGQQGVDSVVFTVTAIDEQPPGQGASLTVTWQ